MQMAHRIRMYPTPEQEKYLRQAAGVARLAWNWGLARWRELYSQGEKPNGMMLKKEFNSIKSERFPFVGQVHRDATARPFANLQDAFVRFFKKQNKYPRFKKKGKSPDSIYWACDKARIEGERIRFNRLGWVDLAEPLRFFGTIKSYTVHRFGDIWYVSVCVEFPDHCAKRERTGDGVVGVDLGVTHLATLSNGEVVEAPRPLKKMLVKLRRLQRKMARQVKFSKNWYRTVTKIGRLHHRICNVRRDALDKLTDGLCRKNQTVVIETLNVKGMMKNRRLARAISDVGFYEFKRELLYKSGLYGTEVVMADPFFPSSKTCSVCGWKNEDLTLSDRTFRCERCGNVMDRDLNAAQNLCTLGLRGTYACVEGLGIIRPEIPTASVGGDRVRPADRQAMVVEAGTGEGAHLSALER